MRSRMQLQRTRDTAPEMALRRILHSTGLRYRVDRAPLPGLRRRADIVFGPAKVAVFVDGCFWHGCPEHGRQRTKANSEYWSSKIERNRSRDAETDSRLTEAGWAVVRVWEHEDPAEVAALVVDVVQERRHSTAVSTTSSATVRPPWADEHPEALKELVDHTITLVGGGDDAHRGWGLPAGWVPIVNRLHRGLGDLIGDYEVVRVGNKMGALRYAIDRPGDMSPEVNRAVNDLLQTARAESLSTCDLCGGPARGRLSFGATRCDAHEPTREHPVPGARARPPGWRPQSKPKPPQPSEREKAEAEVERLRRELGDDTPNER